MANRIKRSTKYAVIPVKSLRAINPLSDDQVVAAQANVTPDMIRALEDMVNAAKSGSIGDRALSMRAVAWTKQSVG